jgi:transcriptional regulator with XRE-family HTH domain
MAMAQIESIDIRELVQALRQKKGWTQRDLAAKIGVQQADVQRIEHAGRNILKQVSLCFRMLPYFLQEDLISERELLLPAKKKNKK